MELFTYFSIRWWVVLASVAIHFIVGMLWYGPFFGKRWLEAIGLKTEDISGGNAGVYGYAAVNAIVVVFGLSFILNAIGVQSIAQGLMVTLIVWVTLNLAPFINHLNFEMRAKSLIYITTLHDLVGWLLMTILIVIS